MTLRKTRSDKCLDLSTCVYHHNTMYLPSKIDKPTVSYDLPSQGELSKLNTDKET